ncbi:MAG: hypothetical protein HUU20_09965 [Pirellulales bacterium]|nr:hypothetical protein [Pirellulales bacterium]
MTRFYQILLIASVLGFSWLAMMGVHEAGHVLHAWLSGGEVTGVVLHPLAISRTDYGKNPHPLFVAWGGAVWGGLLPAAVWLLVRRTVPAHAYLARFFAGFCLVANGAYLAAGSFFAGGGDDAGVLLQHGAEQWQLLGFGVPAFAGGLWLWNGLGPSFGLGIAGGRVDKKAAVGAGIALVLLALLFTVTCP